MLKIVFENHELYYDPTNTTNRTEFFLKTTVQRKKYFFFGSLVEVPAYEHVFTIGSSCQNPQWTKKEWQNWMKEHLKTIERKKELLRGELI